MSEDMAGPLEATADADGPASSRSEDVGEDTHPSPAPRSMRTDCPDCRWDVTRREDGTVAVINDFHPCRTCSIVTLHDSRVDITDERWKWPEHDPHCFRCGADMRHFAVHDVPEDAGTPRGDELDNECHIIFTGGYGSFYDAIGGKLPTLIICHECAHEMCAWLGIDPRHWHTHSVYGGQHGDHHDLNK